MINKKDSHVLERFGQHIKSIRQNSGLTLRELSGRCNLDNSKISKIEQGKINITLSTVFELSKGLDVPAMDLLNFNMLNQAS